MSPNNVFSGINNVDVVLMASMVCAYTCSPCADMILGGLAEFAQGAHPGQQLGELKKA